MSISKEKILNFCSKLVKPTLLQVKSTPMKRHPFKLARTLYIRYLTSSFKHNSISHKTSVENWGSFKMNLTKRNPITPKEAQLHQGKIILPQREFIFDKRKIIIYWHSSHYYLM